MEDDRVVIRCVNRDDRSKSGAFARLDGAGHDGIEGEFYVGGGEGVAVVEFYAVAQVEHVSERVGRFPGLREVRNDIHVRIEREETRENHSIDVFGKGVRADARIEVRGH